MKKIPYDYTSENYLIGNMLLENNCIDEVRSLIKPEHFYSEQNRLLCSKIYKMQDSDIKVDTISVYQFAKNEIDAATISKLTLDIPSSANIKYHSAIVYEKYLRRNLIEAINQIHKKTEDETSDIFELIADATKQLTESIEGIPQKETTLYERLEDVLKDVQQRMSRKDKSCLVSTYFPSFNKYTGGIMPGEMISLQGKDKAGKSTFAYKLVLDFAINQQIPVGIFSYEMGERLLDWKAISLETGTEFQKLRNPQGYYLDETTKLTTNELDKTISTSLRRFRGTKIYTCDKILNEKQIKIRIKEWIKNYGVMFFLIDYIGLIPATGKHDSREREISYLSRFFKQTTQELSTNLLILSQQNRDGDIAESLGLQRDPDFAFSIQKPYDEDIQSIRINGNSFTMTEDDYLITLKRSRMSKQKKQFIVGYTSQNQFCELDKERGDREPAYIQKSQEVFNYQEEPF